MSSVPSSSSEMGDNAQPSPTISNTSSKSCQTDRKTKTLVLCFDGTGDKFDPDNSNVVKFFNLLKRDDPDEQMVYYQTGIGTYTSPQPLTPVGQAVSKTLDKMVAWNLDAHVIAGYEFLMQNYKKDDKICLFGFSRGAYTARALAGMLYKVGLLPPCNHQHVPFAYKMYVSDRDCESKHGKMFFSDHDCETKHSKEFKKHFSTDVKIDFIGVWDTVCSVGLIPQRLPFVASNTAIGVFRHALSLDERRVKFEVNHYHDSDPPEPDSNSRAPLLQDPIMGTHTRESTAATGATAVSVKDTKTDVKEVWFAGCHSDVGGGSEKNEKTNSLARISLRWMIREIFRTKTDIRFRTELLKEIGLVPDPLQPQAEPEVVAEEELEDMKSKINDQLNIQPLWWILEVIPSKQRESKKWWKYRLNFGRGRIVPPVPNKNKFYIHRTVKMREEGGRYKPKATWTQNLKPVYVD